MLAEEGLESCPEKLGVFEIRQIVTTYLYLVTFCLTFGGNSNCSVLKIKKEAIANWPIRR